MERLRTDYFEVWAPSPVLPLIRFANRVRAIADTGLDSFAIPDRKPTPGLLESLSGIDSVVSWYGANRPEFRAAVAGMGWPFEFLPALPGAEARVHAADFYLRQAAPKCSDGEAVPSIPCPRWDGGFAVIQPFSGSPKKNWPLERFRAVARHLSGRLPVKWCAGPEETLEGAVRFDDLYELACWMAGARLYVGNDSGITHLAAAAGAPVVALFGPTDPAVWAPRGERVRVIAAPSIEDITVEQVLAAT
jgi:hypothetical protein